MGRYFQFALMGMGHEVITAGPYSHGRIPWDERFYYPTYKLPPFIETPDGNVMLSRVLEHCKPDLIIQAGDTIFMPGKSPVPNVMIATDPHAVDYTQRRLYADYFFNMQHHYMKPGDYWLPYAYEPAIHSFTNQKNEFDIVLSGLQYPNRVAFMDEMKKRGYKVLNTLGLIYDDYTMAYNKGKIAFVWSSKQDLPARFWEGLAMKRLVLTNRVPDLAQLEFVEGEDYVGFDTLEEAVEKAQYYLAHDEEREKIAANGWKKVQPHTYEARCKQLLEIVKL